MFPEIKRTKMYLVSHNGLRTYIYMCVCVCVCVYSSPTSVYDTETYRWQMMSTYWHTGNRISDEL